MKVAMAIAALLWLAPADSAAAAVRPADGQFSTDPALPGLLSFVVQDGGRQIAYTNALAGDLLSCSWVGAWVDPPGTIALSGASFTAHRLSDGPVPDRVTVAGTFTSGTTATVTLRVDCIRESGPLTVTRTFDLTSTTAPPEHCTAAREVGGFLKLGGAGAARAHGAVEVTHRATDCAAVERALDAALTAKDESLALGGIGWVMTRLKRVRVGARLGYRVRAVDGTGASLGYTRAGRLPIDHSIYRAGQGYLVADSRSTLRPCTANVPLQSAAGLLAISAGHCGLGGAASVGSSVVRRYAKDPRRNFPLGTVAESVQEPGFDAQATPILPTVHVAQQIERGELAPLTVTSAADVTVPGTRVCFAGRTSGADRCGKLRKDLYRGLRCAAVKTRPGDSGGPVYTDPKGGLTTSVVGVVDVSHTHGLRADDMCFTPMSQVMTRFAATFPLGPIVR